MVMKRIAHSRSSNNFAYRKDTVYKEIIRTLLLSEKSSDYLNLVGLFIPDLLKGEKPRRTKHIPTKPKMLVFIMNYEARKEYDYGKVHH